MAALLRAWWCNVRLMYLLGVGNDHAKFAVLCGFCGLFAAAAVAAAGLSPSANLFAFDLRAAAISLYAWGKGFAAAVFGWGGGGGISEEDFVAAFFLPTVAVAAACATAAAALPAIRFAQVSFFSPGLRFCLAGIVFRCCFSFRPCCCFSVTGVYKVSCRLCIFSQEVHGAPH